MDNPLRAALKVFDAAVRGAFDIVAAFWRPLLRQPEKQEPPVIERTKAPAPTEEEPPRPIRSRQRSKPLPRKPTAETKLEPATQPKRSVKEDLELEREERAQKTERLRKLRLEKQAAANQKKNPSSDGRGEAAGDIKE
jgi:hypothetical protein